MTVVMSYRTCLVMGNDGVLCIWEGCPDFRRQTVVDRHCCQKGLCGRYRKGLSKVFLRRRNCVLCTE